MGNVFCTLAMGDSYAELAAFLAADLNAYKVPMVVLTDSPGHFKKFPHISIVEHRPKKFSYHDKRIALKEALKLGETAIFVDADTAIWFGADRRMVRQALAHSFPAGLHAAKISPEDVYYFPHIENLGKEWGLKFNRNVISYWEGLFALTRHPKLDEFFAIWERFAEEAEQRGYNGAGEGACFGIAAEASGLPRHYTIQMLESRLPYIFWHTRLAFNKRKLYHHKFGLKEILKGNLNLQQHCWGW
jgi:hypothetical protein